MSCYHSAGNGARETEHLEGSEGESAARIILRAQPLVAVAPARIVLTAEPWGANDFNIYA